MYHLISQFIQTNKIIDQQKSTDVKDSNNVYRYINLAYMKEVSNCNIDYEKTVTEQFLEIIPTDLYALENAWQQKNIYELKRLAHNMKSSVSIMGLHEILQPYLAALEYEELNAHTFKKNFNSLKIICTNAVEEAKHFYNEISAY